MKYLHIFIAILFVLFGAVQFNDPDPILWVSIYLGVAICAIAVFLGKGIRLLALAGFLGCMIGAAILLPDFLQWMREGMPSIVSSMKAETPYIELVREFLGYLISAGFYLFYYRRSIQLSKHTQN